MSRRLEMTVESGNDCNLSQEKEKLFLVRFRYCHCCDNVIMRPSVSHNSALELLEMPSFDPRINLSLRPWARLRAA